MGEKAFVVWGNDKCVAAGVIDPDTGEPIESDDWYYRNWLIDLRGGHPVAINSDSGEPEDQTLTRNFRWVCDLANRLVEEGRQNG